MSNDPIINRVCVFMHRVIIFVFLWMVTFLAICFEAGGGGDTSLADWWRLVDTAVGLNWSPLLLHFMELIAIGSMLPVIVIFWIVGIWWRRQGLDALRRQSGTEEK